ncbi:MAG: hypothetical protein GWP08_21210, partial [Nitrospiraceae bacterium]|nr:hypothetical protein [Nitrospiraceae bacterium]
KNPKDTKPQFRRVRFAYDGRYKLYLDGRMYEVPKDWLEARVIPVDGMTPAQRVAQRAARAKLQGVLDAMPAWSPDNDTFNGELDDAMKKYLKRYGVEVRVDLAD